MAHYVLDKFPKNVFKCGAEGVGGERIDSYQLNQVISKNKKKQSFKKKLRLKEKEMFFKL